MTAPAVVRHWNDPPSVRADLRVGDRDERSAVVDQRDRVARALQMRMVEGLVWLRRTAPLGALLFTGLVAHVAVAPHLALRGAIADVLGVCVVAVSVTGGSRAGAGFGFAAGLGADLFLATPLGTSALAYTLVGHVLGRSARPRSPGASASALCRPDSSCFACRTRDPAPALTKPRSSRARQRALARRAALRRSVFLTVAGVAAGRVGTAIVATALAGVPFPDIGGLLRSAGVAAISAPLGPAAFAILRRLGRAAVSAP